MGLADQGLTLLEALQLGGVSGAGAGGLYVLYRVWRFVSADFVEPYRRDTQDSREEAAAARAEAAAARVEATETRRLVNECEVREARLIVRLERAGIHLPPDGAPP